MLASFDFMLVISHCSKYVMYKKDNVKFVFSLISLCSFIVKWDRLGWNQFANYYKSPWEKWGFLTGSSGKESACQCRRCRTCGFNPWVWKIPWRRSKWQTTSILADIILWTEEPDRLQSMGLQKNWTQLSRHRTGDKWWLLIRKLYMWQITFKMLSIGKDVILYLLRIKL